MYVVSGLFYRLDIGQTTNANGQCFSYTRVFAGS